MGLEGGAENAGVANAGVENVGADCRDGKCRSRQSMESRKNNILGLLALAAAVSACVDQQFGTLPQDLRSTDTREQFKRKLKNWPFKCAYSRRHV